MKKFLAALLACFCIASFAFGGENAGSDADAIKMAQKAKDYLLAKGNDKAFAQFNNPKGQFKNKSLYIWIVDYQGKVMAHGGNPALVGQSLIELRDTDGKYFIKESIKIVKEKGKGWVRYKWTNPVTKKIEAKSTYLVTTDDLVIGCGVYK